jgi:phage tail-like protein
MSVTRQLVVRRAGKTVLTFTVESGTCTIGRSPDNDLVLPDAGVAPRHAQLKIESGTAVLEDLDGGSTLVGGVRLRGREPRALGHGEIVEIGPFELIYRVRDRSDVTFVPSRSDVAAQTEESAPPVTTPVLVAVGAGETTDVNEVNEADAPVRETAAPERPGPGPRAHSRYMRYLPAIFHDDDFLSRFLQILEQVWEPLEQRQDHIDAYLDPATCPAEWLPWMASWFGIVLRPHWPEARKRAFLAHAVDVYRWRGTAYGLERVIETCTGARPEIGLLPENPFVFRVVVRAPDAADLHFEHDLNELIATHKPAHTGYTLEILR